MSILVDTSVWVDHFRNTNKTLVNLLEACSVLTHPMVQIELACGTPPAPRAKTLSDIALLEPSKQASQIEVLEFIEKEMLYGLGCGLVDISLLASTLITPGTRLWTYDKRLHQLAYRFNVAFQS